jgi:periplasmic protein TonB
MKYIRLIAACLILSANIAFGQIKDSALKAMDADTVKCPCFVEPEMYPEFPGGFNAFTQFLAKNVHYPLEALAEHIEGRVIHNFVVEKDGSLSNITVLRGIGGGCDEEAVRVMKLSPKWKPATQKRQVVRVSYAVPIPFMLTK